MYGRKYVLRMFTIFPLIAAFILACPNTDRAYAGTKLDVENDGAHSIEGMTWDGKTLTLNNCNFNGQIKIPKDSIINVKGTNNIVMNQSFDESGAIIGSGALTITGGGTLNVTNAAVTRDNCYAIVCKKELTIENVTINASAAAAGEADISAGITARKAMKITGSTINASGCEGARTSAGIRGSKSVFIGTSNVSASGATYGIVSSGDALGISYSNINAAGGKAAVKAKTAMQFAGVSGGAVGEKNDRWYAMNGSDPATNVQLTVAN